MGSYIAGGPVTKLKLNFKMLDSFDLREYVNLLTLDLSNNHLR